MQLNNLNYLENTGEEPFFQRLDEFEEDIMRMICDWLQSFDGWGLFFLLLDHRSLQSHILEDLEDSENNVVDEVFEDYRRLIEPHTYVSDCSLLKGPEKGNNWTKTLRIIFTTFPNRKIIVDIFIEKLKSSKLLDLAADVVAASIDEERTKDIESMSIPKTLQSLLRKKILDLKWARFDVEKTKKSHKLQQEDIESTMLEFLFDAGVLVLLVIYFMILFMCC